MPPQRSPLTRLPLVTLYVTDRCNSRCVSCDYWRHGRDDLTLAAVSRLLPSLARLQTEMVLLSGGEPLLNPEWPAIAELLRGNGLKVWLLTSGLALAKQGQTDDAISELAGDFAIRRQLLIVLHKRRLRAGGGTAVLPRAAVHDAAEVRHVILVKHIGNTDQHALDNQNRADITSDATRPGASRTNGVAL